MPRRLVSAALLACVPGMAPASDLAPDLAGGLRACRSLTTAAARLACYDALPAGAATLTFSGHGSHITPGFQIDQPQRLRFENTDAVMVIYLLDATGAVVQNLHQGGVGTGAFLIVEPGQYRVQINATGGWRIWLETPEPPG